MSYAILETDSLIQSAVEIVAVGVVSIAMLMIAIKVMEKLLPFSVKHELEEDHNTAAAILMASIVIGVALVISAVVRE